MAAPGDGGTPAGRGMRPNRSRGNSQSEGFRRGSLTFHTGSPSPATSPPQGYFASPGPGTPFHNRSQNTSFTSPLSASTTSDVRSPPNQLHSSGEWSEPRQSLRSRGSSIGSSFSEGVRSLLRPVKRKLRKKKEKEPRDRSARPSRPDVLDKDDTRKLTKFWDSVDTEEGDPEFERPDLTLAGVQPPSLDGPDFADLALRQVPSALPSIIEHPFVESSQRAHNIQTSQRSYTSSIMDPSRLAPESSLDGEKKQKAIQDAKDMYQRVLRNCERTNTNVPPYDFIELIGKGGFARVYKCRERRTGELVAIKIVNTDDVDYVSHTLDKDDTIRDFRKEVDILQQLKDSNAKNVNMIHNAFDLQEQLWIVSDYCTGGSIRTLMRAQPATHPGLEEQFIIPVARELAVAIKSVHDIGVIHRDIKCTNVYVTEEGQIQLGDFGIVGVMDDGISKRRTMIGTPHYMPREMHVSVAGGNQVLEAYGTEVDIWSFGCSVYEMATGQPPNARLAQGSLNTALLNAPRLEGGNHSQELRDFVAFCLNSDPQERPTAEEVLKHPYIANTYKKHPTRKLIELIHKYKVWEYGGGWRQSLFFAGGAPPVAGTGDQSAESDEEGFDDWNFSTSDSFNEAFDKRYSQMMAGQPADSLRLDTSAASSLPPIVTQDLSAYEQLQQKLSEHSANRGERSLERLWKPDSEPYELHTPVEDLPQKTSDLPLRSYNSSAPARESFIEIDLDSAGEDNDMPNLNFEFGDIPTLKAKSARRPSQYDEEEEQEYTYASTEDDRQKRATMDWKFPAAKRATMDWTFPKNEPMEPEDPDRKMRLPRPGEDDDLPPGFRPMLKHSATEPIGQFMGRENTVQPMEPLSESPNRESMGSMIDLDMGDMSFEENLELMRPSTAVSAAGSTMTDMTSGNPFDLEDDPTQNEIDRNRFSYHKQWQSDGGPIKRSSTRSSVPMHTRGTSLSSTASELERPATADDELYKYQYNRKLSESMRQQLNGSLADDVVDLNAWPDFGPNSGFDEVKTYTDDLDGMLARQREMEATRPHREPLNGYSLQRPGTLGSNQPEVEFPRALAPHPDALAEDADRNTVQQELNRMLNDFDDTLRATTRALQAHTGIDAESEGEGESGWESMPNTGDEEGF